MIAAAIDSYPGTLAEPPPSAYDEVEMKDVTAYRGKLAYFLEVPLYRGESEISDQELSVTVFPHDGVVDTELDDIKVP